MALDGLYYYLYNEVAFIALDRVSSYIYIGLTRLIYENIYVYIYIYMYIYICMYMCVYIHIYIHIHMFSMRKMIICVCTDSPRTLAASYLTTYIYIYTYICSLCAR